MTDLQTTGFGKLLLARGSRRIAAVSIRQVEELVGYHLLNQSVVHDREKTITAH